MLEMALSAAELKRVNSIRGRFIVLISLVTIVLVLIILLIARPPISPIPKAITSAVNFPIYYPDPGQLPTGFNLNKSTIQYIKPGVVIYGIDYPKSQRIIISEEARQSQATINQFISSYIPLHDSFSTPMGQAALGAYNAGKSSLRSVISLPIKDGPWLIATAPSNISRTTFIQVVDSLTKG